MKRNNIVIWLIVFQVYSCDAPSKHVVLEKLNNDNVKELIEYDASPKYGNYINATQENRGVKTHFSLKISENGDVLHVLKYHLYGYTKKVNDNVYYEDQEFLITDTSQKNEPSFFSHSIIGYYDDPNLTNKILDGKVNSHLVPLSTEEMKFLLRVDLLTKANHIRYNSFDTTRVLGWFRYKFLESQ